jgi:hypothetical protein
MQIRIMVAHHKNYYTKASNIFMPIHVGKKNSKVTLNFQGDDQGISISEKNNIYCELTATYWGWKNLKEIDYLGICHYRRYFAFEGLSYYSRFKKSLKKILYSNTTFRNQIFIINSFQADEKLKVFENKLKRDILDNDIEVYALRPAIVDSKNVKEFFFKPAGYYPIDLLEKIVERDFPCYSFYFKKVISGKKIYYGNMVLMKQGIFNKYAEFLFSVLNKHEEESKEKAWCFSPIEEGCYSRLSGYLGELLTSCFVEKCIRDGMRVKLLNSYMLDIK